MKPDGGPAFPHIVEPVAYGENTVTIKTFTYGGMTLRDYFAAAALTGVAGSGFWSETPPDATAKAAYQYADAMLDERSRT